MHALNKMILVLIVNIRSYAHVLATCSLIFQHGHICTNFRGFRGKLAIREIFILEISLANFDLHESESRILGDPQK